jgi:hypothetical protein
VLRVLGDGKGGQLRLDECGRVERLLVTRAGGGLVSVPAPVAREAERPAAEPRLVTEPAQRGDPRLRHFLPAECDASCDQGVRQAGVVVRQLVLEPQPARLCVGRVRRRELLERPLQDPPRHEVEPVGVEMREAEGGIGARPQRGVGRDGADDGVEQALARTDDGGNPGGGEDLPEGPDRPSDMIAGVGVVDPAPVVAHEVPHAALAVRRVLEERDRPVEDRGPDLLVFATRELERDDRETGDVVDAVPALSIRDDAVGMLDDAHVVHEREKVIRS